MSSGTTTFLEARGSRHRYESDDVLESYVIIIQSWFKTHVLRLAVHGDCKASSRTFERARESDCSLQTLRHAWTARLNSTTTNTNNTSNNLPLRSHKAVEQTNFQGRVRPCRGDRLLACLYNGNITLTENCHRRRWPRRSGSCGST